MILEDLYWRQIMWLWIIPVPLLYWLFQQLINRRKRYTIADKHLWPWVITNQKQYTDTLPLLLFYTGWVFIAITIAGPRTAITPPPDYSPRPDQLMIILDVSPTMNTIDGPSSRKAQAVHRLQNELNSLPPHLSTGLILFSGEAVSVLPPTTDSLVFSYYLNHLDQLSLPIRGSNLSAALSMAETKMGQSLNYKRILILSDGDYGQNEWQKVKEKIGILLKDSRLSITVIGFGQEIPHVVPGYNSEFLTYQNRPVFSHLHRQEFTELTQTSGFYFIENKDIKTDLLSLADFPPLRFSQKQQQSIEWQYYHSILIACAFLSLILSLRRKQGNTPGHHVNIITLILCFALYLPASGTLQADDLQLTKQAQKALESKKYTEAQQLFSRSDSEQARFGHATACYYLKNYDCAKQLFSRIAWQSQDRKIRAHATFNLANTYYYLKDYPQAMVLYRQAQQFGVDPKMVEINLSFAHSAEQSRQQHLEDIRETLRRAQWRADANGTQRPALQDLLVSDRNLLRPDLKQQLEAWLLQPHSKPKSEVTRWLKDQSRQGPLLQGSTNWIRTEEKAHAPLPQLLNRLFELELEIPSSVTQPMIIKGQRPW